MKSIYLIVLLALCACNKHEDRPPQNVPHVAGSWVGTGTDDAIGFFNITVDLTQSDQSAAGTFTMVGAVATVTGNVSMSVGPTGGNNMRVTLTRISWTVSDPANSNRLCAATLTASPSYITGGATNFHYTMSDCHGGEWTGGTSLTKQAGTN